MNDQLVEELAQPVLQLLFGIQTDGVSGNSLFFDELDYRVLDQTKGVYRLMERYTPFV